MAKRENWRNRVSRMLEIPAEAALGSLKITIWGNKEFLVENHQGIVSYTDKNIKIKITGGWLLITGETLNLQDLQNEQILLTGKIKQLKYEEC